MPGIKLWRMMMFGSIGEKVIVGVISAIALGAVYAAWDAIRGASTGFVVPKGAVVAFDLENGCPSGWRADFSKGAGKFILGTGKGELRYQGPHQPVGAPNIVSMTEVDWDDQGGAETHTLTVDQMPTHNHGGQTINSPDRAWLTRPGHTTISRDEVRDELDFSARGSKHNHEIEAAGGNQPHNNMPPYIALYFCKKE